MANVGKVPLNTLHNPIGLPYAKFALRPFEGIFMALGAVTAVNTVAQGDHIRRDRTRAGGIGKWYPVVRHEFVPQARRSAADSAATLEVGQSPKPIVERKSVRKVPLARLPALITYALDFWIALPRALYLREHSIWMLVAIALIRQARFVTLVIFSCDFAFLIRMLRVVLLFSGIHALAAPVMKAVLSPSVRAKASRILDYAAFRAAFRRGILNHAVPPIRHRAVGCCHTANGAFVPLILPQNDGKINRSEGAI